MGATTAVLLAVKTGMDYLNERKQAGAANAQGQYIQASEEQNAKLSEAQGADALQRGQLAESQQRAATRQEVGGTRASLAGQGVDINYGSANDVQASEAGIGELDALTIRNNAAREAWGYQVEAVQHRKQGELAAMAGANQAAALRQDSYSTLLTGGLNTYGLFQKYQNTKQDLRTSPYRPGKP